VTYAIDLSTSDAIRSINMDCMCKDNGKWDSTKVLGDIGCSGINSKFLFSLSKTFTHQNGDVRNRSRVFQCSEDPLDYLDTSSAKSCNDLSEIYGGGFMDEFCCTGGSDYNVDYTDLSDAYIKDNLPLKCNEIMDCMCKDKGIWDNAKTLGNTDCSGVNSRFLFGLSKTFTHQNGDIRDRSSAFQCSEDPVHSLDTSYAETCEDLSNIYGGGFMDEFCCTGGSDYNVDHIDLDGTYMEDNLPSKCLDKSVTMDCMCKDKGLWDSTKTLGNTSCSDINNMYLFGRGDTFTLRNGDVHQRSSVFQCSEDSLVLDTSDAQTCEDLSTIYGGGFMDEFCCTGGSDYNKNFDEQGKKQLLAQVSEKYLYDNAPIKCERVTSRSTPKVAIAMAILGLCYEVMYGCK